MLDAPRPVRLWMMAVSLAFGIRVCNGSAEAQQPAFSLAHAGTVFDAFSLNGEEIWTVEDGGRMRHRTGSGSGATWSFFTTNLPDGLKDILYRIDFLDDGSEGWAVGQDGWVLRLLPNGVSHPVPFQLDGPNQHHVLWDVRFLDPLNGWLLEEHGLYQTTNGGQTSGDWTQNTILIRDANGNQLTPDDLQNFRFYSLDIRALPQSNPPVGPPLLGLMCAEPGVIFRSLDGSIWDQVFDIRSLCPLSALPTCMNPICKSPPPALGFEPWDVEIQRGAAQPLALMVGGFGTGCGMIFRSTDLGLTWASEPHECQCSQPGCHALPCTNYPEWQNSTATNTDTWRWSSYLTLYSVSIFDSDKTAIAGGYGGQQLVRDATNQVWLDRSRFSTDLVHAIDAVTVPMYATAANSGTASTGVGMFAGAGGVIRHVDFSALNWNVPEVQGDSWRVQDVWFTNGTTGWAVGQRYRIAKSLDSGTTWETIVDPEPDQTSGKNYMSIAMNDQGTHGVAVGQAPSIATEPRVSRSTSVDGLHWSDASRANHSTTGTGSQGKVLREVCWAGGSVFWTAGQAGLIYKSTDDGQTWTQELPPGYATWAAFSSFDINGLAYRDATSGVFVGSIGGAPKAFIYRSGGTPAWIDVSPNAAGLTVTILSDVDILLGTDIAYAVGVKIVGGLEEGVILTCDISQPTPANFAEVPTPPTITRCDVGEDLQSVPVLSCVALTSNSDVWVGGECGRVWRRSANQWTPVRSQTDAHIRSLSFPQNNVGFGAALRTNYSAFSIVRYP